MNEGIPKQNSDYPRYVRRGVNGETKLVPESPKAKDNLEQEKGSVMYKAGDVYVREKRNNEDVEVDEVKEDPTSRDISVDEEEVDKPDSPRRRQFLKAAGVATATAATITAAPWAVKEFEKMKERAKKAGRQESAPEHGSLFDQIEEYGEVRDMEVAQNTHFHQHIEKILEKDRTEHIVANIKKLELDEVKFTKPFAERGFQPELPYMIGSQESDFRNNAVSSSNAIGVLGIRNIAAKDTGHEHEDAKDPYQASDIAAKLLEKNRDNYVKSNDLDLVLHAYNSGWKLKGFTLATPEEERNVKNFYEYMRKRINKKLLENAKKGDEKEDIEVLLAAELEVLRYVPEIKAKYAVMRKDGFYAELKEKLEAGEDMLTKR